MKRKILIALVLVLSLLFAIALSSCGTESDGHNHMLSIVERTDATCTANGNMAYYICNGCDKWFEDADGKNEITDKSNVVLLKTAHNLSLCDETESSCTVNGNTVYYKCNGCDKWFEDADGENEITDKSSVLIPKKAHSLTPVEGKKSTCTEDGNSAYYICSVCEKWYEDENGETEITDKTSVIISKGHHLAAVELKEATCTKEGNIAYYTCSVCEKWFKDEDCEVEIVDKTSVVLEKVDHNFKGNTCTMCGIHRTTEGLEYTLSDDGTYYICSGIGTATDTDIYIADTYDNKPVISIGQMAFYNCRSLTSITIPESVTSIGAGAFGLCGNLTSITIPQGITSISAVLFYGCTSLRSINIPDSVTSIGQMAFYSCTNLKSINIPDRVTSIGDSAFHGCSSLTSIIIPDSVASIGQSAFYGCTNIIEIEDGVSYVGKWLIYGDSSATEAIIRDGTKGIANYAYYYCHNLTTVKIPDSVAHIGVKAFDGTKAKTTYNLLVYVDNWLIGNEISTVISGNIRANTRGIADGAYSNALTFGGSVMTLPEGLIYIGNNAFYGCTGLASINIPDSVTYIGNSAFYNCSSLTSITIPNSVTKIGSETFNGCSNLKAVYIEDLSAWCKITFNGIYSNPLHNGANLYLKGELVKELVIPNDITEIKDYAFYNCTSLTSITIPNSVTSIGDRAFDGCTNLKTVINRSSLNIVKGSTDYGYVAYYADTVINDRDE